MLGVNNNCRPVPIDPPCDQDVAFVTSYLCLDTNALLCGGSAIYFQMSPLFHKQHNIGNEKATKTIRISSFLAAGLRVELPLSDLVVR